MPDNNSAIAKTNKLVAQLVAGSENRVDALNTQSTFDIRNFTESLTPSKEKNKYICPVCEGHNLSINPKNGKYQCFNGCACEDIREAIKPWDEVLAERRQSNPTSKKPSSAFKKPQEPILLPSGELAIATLAEIPTDTPQAVKPQIVPSRVRKDLLAKGVTEQELEGITATSYDYGDHRASHRYQAPCTSNAKGYEKTFAINRVDEQEKTHWNKGNYAWAAYRQAEAIAAVQAVPDDKIPVLLSHEGEKCVEAGRSVKLAGITSLGNAGLEDLVCIFTEIQLKLNGRQFILTHLQDNDPTGSQKAEKLARVAVRCGIPFVAIDLKAIKPELCDKGDVVDILASGMSGEELAALILEEIRYARLDQEGQAGDSEDEGGNEELAIIKAFCQTAFESLYTDKRWICANDKLYCYDTNHYEYVPDAVEIKRIRDFCNSYAVPGKKCITFPYANPATVAQVLNWVKMSVQVDARLLNPPGLSCTNGVLQILWNGDSPSWKLAEHTPDLYYTYRPLATYRSDADPQHCDRLLEALEPAQREIFLRTIAASLDLKAVRQYKGRTTRALLLKGDGSNGKDSLREVVSLMYGKQGITGCTLTDFAAYDEGRKFSLAKLAFSRVNWSSENANSTRLDKIQSLKAFITGDPLDSERKGVDAEEFEPTGIAVFNVNETPTMQGALEAIQSRYGILEFNKTFKIGADPSKGELEADSRFKYDPMFMQLLVVPAFLNRVLQSLQDLMKEGIDYSCTKAALEGIQAENCHLFQFCQDTGLGYVSEAVTSVADIWEQLEAWYKESGTLTYDNGKALWVDQVKPSDKNVKAAQQVIPRFLQIFPKAKRVMVPRQGGGKPVSSISGISFVSFPYNPLSTSRGRNHTSEKSNHDLTMPVTIQSGSGSQSVTTVTIDSIPLGENQENNQKDAPTISDLNHHFSFETQTSQCMVTVVTDAYVEPPSMGTSVVTGMVTEPPCVVTNPLIENKATSVDQPSLGQQIKQAWDSQWTLGNLVLAIADTDKLRQITKHYTEAEIKHIKLAANVCWKPGIEKPASKADWQGELRYVWAINGKDLRIGTEQKAQTNVKRNDLAPWLGIG
jgi:putative DNA primase/helicase